jgi:hypothetical protein
MAEKLSGNAFSLAAGKGGTHYFLIAKRSHWRTDEATVDAFVRACVERGYSESWLRAGKGAPRGESPTVQAPPLPTHVVDTLSMAREAVARLVKARIPRGEAWDLIDLVADDVRDDPSVADYVAAAMAHPRAQALIAANRPRLPTPPPPMDRQDDPNEPRLLAGRRDVRDEVPPKGEPEGPSNVRRRATSKGHRR